MIWLLRVGLWQAVEKDSVQEKVPVLELDNVNDLDAEEKQIEDPRLHSNLCFLPPNGPSFILTTTILEKEQSMHRCSFHPLVGQFA